MTVIPRLPERFLAEIRDRVALVDLVGQAVKLTKRGREHTGLCPFHAEKSPSFTVNEAKGFYHCFGCGAHGDAIGWLMNHRGLRFLDAVAELAAIAGVPLPEGFTRSAAVPARAEPTPRIERADRADLERKRARDIEHARRIFAMAAPAEDVLPVVNYWRHRGLERLPIPADIRGSAALDYQHGDVAGLFPAMVAAMRDAGGAVVGVHRTYLAPGGHGKAPVPAAKKMLGQAGGSAIRLTAACETMVVGEGIETTGAALVPFWDEAQAAPMLGGARAGAWCAMSLDNLCGGGLGRGELHPVQPEPSEDDPRPAARYLPSEAPDPERPGIRLPDCVRHVVILQDCDGKDPLDTAARIARAVARFTRLERRAVTLSKAFRRADFNDLLRGAA